MSSDTFFTAGEPDVHSEAWRAQALLARRVALQPYNDALYAVVRDSLIARRAEIRASLIAAVASSHARNGLHIPLWTYHAARLEARDPPLDEEAREECTKLLVDDGHQWLVGRVCSDFEGAPGEYEWDADAKSRPVPVHDVVRCTDFVHRIALFFGDGQYRVSFHERAWGDISVPMTAQVSIYELVLHYHPTGIYGRVAECIREAKAKYATHVPSHSEADLPWLFTGRPRTPPSSPRPVAPPPAPEKVDFYDTEVGKAELEYSRVKAVAQQIWFDMDINRALWVTEPQAGARPVPGGGSGW